MIRPTESTRAHFATYGFKADQATKGAVLDWLCQYPSVEQLVIMRSSLASIGGRGSHQLEYEMQVTSINNFLLFSGRRLLSIEQLRQEVDNPVEAEAVKSMLFDATRAMDEMKQRAMQSLRAGILLTSTT